jgi:hypothetical protein
MEPIDPKKEVSTGGESQSGGLGELIDMSFNIDRGN